MIGRPVPAPRLPRHAATTTWSATSKTRWRRLQPGRQALLVVAHLRKGETYADLAIGFDVGTTTVYWYLREALDLLAAMAPTLEQAIEVALGKAYVILDGGLLRIDRIGMTAKADRAVL